MYTIADKKPYLCQILRLYLVLGAMSVLLLAGVSVLMFAFGSRQPLHPALNGLVEDCEDIPQPCWYGIIPGTTTQKEANTILFNLGYTPTRFAPDVFMGTGEVCDVLIVAEGETGIRMLRLRFCSRRPTTGDVLSSLTKRPTWAAINACTQDFIILQENWQLDASETSVTGEVYNLWLHVPLERPPTNNWRGFAFRWFYERQMQRRICV